MVPPRAPLTLASHTPVSRAGQSPSRPRNTRLHLSPRGCGGIGRRARFRSVWGKPRGGSSPLIRMTQAGGPSKLAPGMLRRLLGVAAVGLALAPVGAAHAASTLGLAEVRDAGGTLLAEARNGSYAYPADGSILRIGSAQANAARVVLRDVSMFNGRVYVSRIVVPARGLAGARVDGLIADGKA